MADPLADLARLEGVPTAVAAARAAVDAVLRDRGVRRLSPEAVSAALVGGARSSAALEDEPEVWLAGAVRLAAVTTELSRSVRRSPAQVLARAHAVVAKDVVADGRLGLLRAGADDDGRLSALAALLRDGTSASALVLAAVAHAEVVVAAPFGTGDGLVARAVERMVLTDGGVDPAGVVTPRHGPVEAYRRALKGYRTGSVPGVRDWLRHCAAAVVAGSEALSVGA